MVPPRVLADIVLVFHFAYAAFVVLGFVAVVLGGALGWVWVRRPVFRYGHLAAMVFVGVEAVIGMACPLTVWEASLRREAGLAAGEENFIGRLVGNLLYYDLPVWVFTTAYISLSVLAFSLLWVVPLRRLGEAPASQLMKATRTDAPPTEGGNAVR